MEIISTSVFSEYLGFEDYLMSRYERPVYKGTTSNVMEVVKRRNIFLIEGVLEVKIDDWNFVA